jgi:WD40 repeat protein
MAIAFSPNGDFLVAGDNDGGLLVFDVVTRKSVRRLSAESISINGIYSVSVSSDGLTLAVVSSQFDSFSLESGANLFWSSPQGFSLTTDPTFQFKDWGEGTVYSVAASSSSLAFAPQYYASGSKHRIVCLWTQVSPFSASISSCTSEAGIFQWWSHSRCNSGIFLLIPGIT